MLYPDFDFRSTSHVRLRPDERCLDDGIISTAWNAGTLHVQYVGLQPIAKSTSNAIGETIWQFAIECQLMLIMYAGVLLNQNIIQEQLGRDSNRDASFTVSERGKDGTVQAIWARIPLGKVIDAFSVGGEFEKTYAKAFVVFTYQLWEEFARPRIALALGVEHEDVASDLMGEWRHLRNLLVHPSKNNEQTYFRNAKKLAKIQGGLRPGNFEVKAYMVFPMMGYLNSLHVIVNPNSLSPAIEIAELDPKIAEQVAIDASGSGMSVMPVWRGFRPPEGT